ncbi:MAG: helix-turn-helix domain-containing protein [Clostridiales bacterium]|nr:helix-turn-helix domain-containing protein [Clostridiales bacterium]
MARTGKVSELIERKISEDPEFAEGFRREGEKLDVAVALMLLREQEGLTQRQLAEKAGKPQSTIARIENGNMNVSYRVLSEIAKAVGKQLEVRFV